MILTKEAISLIAPKSEILLDEPMKEHTTFKVGGPAAMFICPEDRDELKEIVSLCRKSGERYAVIGKGSNLLVSDEGYDGIVICLGEGFHRTEICGDEITALAGASLIGLATVCRRASLTGLEFASGIPGSFGGAIYMNAGAYGGEMSDVIKCVEVIDAEGNFRTLSAAEMEFGYRTSKAMTDGLVVVSGTMKLARGDVREIGVRMNELLTSRREKQPLEYPSAGSTFKRPEGNFAGALIEQAGLKGYSIGGAAVSEKHAGFVINKGDATASDIMELCRYIIKTVEERFGVTLEMEVRLLGKF